MAARFVAEENNELILDFENGSEWIIGRDPDECQLVISDQAISRKHLLVRRTEQGYFIENLSQTNPLYINGQESQGGYLLHPGDEVGVGPYHFRFEDQISSNEPLVEDFLHSEEEEKKEEMEALGDDEPPQIVDNNQIVNSEAVQATSEDTILEVEEEPTLAEINFGIIETGRWLLKVVGGPNNGAEFYMQSGHQYLLGTDPQSCDIIFHDTSVSRQHAKISISDEDELSIEDLKSKNGVLINGTPLDGKQQLPLSMIITLGTTSFVVYDREGEMQTIISPLLSSIVKVLQQDDQQRQETKEADTPSSQAEAKSPSPEVQAALGKSDHNQGMLIFLAFIIGVFVLAGLGVTSLFKVEPVKVKTEENAPQIIQQAIDSFPAVRFSFNKATGGLLLLGHVTNAGEKNQLLYNLQGLKFIKSIDDSGLIIDDFVWQELNSILSKNPAWKSITMYSPAPGQFVLSGYLQTHKQAEQLSSYISLNFPYLDLLKKQVVVEEDVLNQIQIWLQDANLKNVVPKMVNGEVALSGSVPTDKVEVLNNIVNQIKQIPGVRIVNNLIRSQAQEMGVINISNHYMVTGKSRIGDKFTVIINGRILSEGDVLDGMDITKITNTTIFLKKDGTIYRIDY